MDRISISQVGIVPNLSPKVPASPSFADRAAAWREDGFLNRWHLDPIFRRGYPMDIIQYYGHSMDVIQNDDLQVIAMPLDFLSVKYYTRQVVRNSDIPKSSNQPRTVFVHPNPTKMGWEVYPEGLYDILGRVHFDYKFPAIYIAENGATYPDIVNADGLVEDPLRIAYIKNHLILGSRAIAADVPVRGYFVWSLLDNYEWAHGYSKRFGLTYVNYETQDRILKNSAYWSRDFIKANEVEDFSPTS